MAEAVKTKIEVVSKTEIDAVALSLTREEAQVIIDLVGNVIVGTGKKGRCAAGIYYALRKVDLTTAIAALKDTISFVE